jgi:hypothetical protein
MEIVLGNNEETSRLIKNVVRLKKNNYGNLPVPQNQS